MGACTSKDIQHLSRSTQNRLDEEITANLEEVRQQEEEKVKLLLLGPGDSGKSTIFKQMRILYGTPKTADELKNYGAIVRSNIITAVRKLCRLTRDLGIESQLDDENAIVAADTNGMTPREAFDKICAYILDNTVAAVEALVSPIRGEQLGKSFMDTGKHISRAGSELNKNAQLFLQLAEAIEVLWQVSSPIHCLLYGNFSKIIILLFLGFIRLFPTIMLPCLYPIC